MIKRLFHKDSFKDLEREKLLFENMSRIKFFTMVIIVLECFFIGVSFVLPEIYTEGMRHIYQIHYVVLLIGSSLLHIATASYLKHKRYHIKYEIMIYVSLFACIIWGASISLLDLQANISMTVYLTFLFISSFVILIRPDITMLALATIQVVFMMRIPDSPMRFAHQINSSIFVLFTWFVGRYQYFLITERIKKDGIIEEKNRILEKQNQELARVMMVDHLTGVYNRYSLEDILAKKWMEAYIHQHNFIVLMIDIDDFKLFNDSYGHISGDACLKQVSQVLKEVTNKYEGFLFRYGGDEFCLIFTQTEYVDCIIDELHESVRKSDFKIENETVSLGLSIGKYECVPQQAHDEWQSIEKADQALYAVKAKRKRRKTDV